MVTVYWTLAAMFVQMRKFGLKLSTYLLVVTNRLVSNLPQLPRTRRHRTCTALAPTVQLFVQYSVVPTRSCGLSDYRDRKNKTCCYVLRSTSSGVATSYASCLAAPCDQNAISLCSDCSGTKMIERQEHARSSSTVHLITSRGPRKMSMFYVKVSLLGTLLLLQ